MNHHLAALCSGQSRSVAKARRFTRRSITTVGAMAALVVLASCFDDPVTEKVRIRLEEDDYLEVTHEVAFTEQGKEKKALADRLQSLTDSYLRQQDRWSQAFAAVAPDGEKLEWEKELGRLTRAKRTGWFKPVAVERLFAQQGIALTVLEDRDWQEISIYPGASRRATREQRDQVSSAFDGWAEAVVRYVEAMRNVYDYVDANPERASALLRPLYSDLLPPDDKGVKEELSDREHDLVERADKAMDRVSDVVVVPADEPYSLNELSMMVFDPFGYDLSIICRGAVVTATGFSSQRDQTVTHQRHNLWTAFELLEGKWLAPDPLLMIVRRGRAGDDRTVSLEEIVSRKRFATRSLSAAEARRALESELRPPEVLRVRCQRFLTDPTKP